MSVKIAGSAMTVAQLREALAGMPDDQLVIMSADAEGNTHSPLCTVGEAMYWPETPWNGEVYATPEEITAPGSPYDPVEDAAPDESLRVVLLAPVN
jgi:hypothetical protein